MPTTTSRVPAEAPLGVRLLILCVLLLFIAVDSISAQDGAERTTTAPDLKQLSLEQLMNLEVTSVAKKEQRVAATAAAVFVVTQEDIRRSGVTSIPEALRLVPGVEVSRVDGNSWAVGIRVFGSGLSRSVLVLIDGRSVYTPLFAGVYWEAQDTLLEDIERIEVIRGPGGTIWGANAVNGVINIITKNAADTQGALITARWGTPEPALRACPYCRTRTGEFQYPAG